MANDPNDPWAKFRTGPAQPASQPQGDPVIARDPYKVEDQQIQRNADARSAITTQTSVADTAHDNRTTDIKNRIGNPQDLRKEYDALPEVKAYKVAAQQLAQALQTGEGPQADLALTYAFAKAMDPDSVVRESEQASVAGSQAWLDAAAENVKKQFGMDGAGSYTPEARAALRQQIIRSVATREKIYSERRKQFEELAKINQIDPFEVVGNHTGDAFVEQARAYDQQRRAAGANVAPVGGLTGAGATPPAIGPEPTASSPFPGFRGGDGPMQRNTSGVRNEDDPALAGLKEKYAALLETSPEPGKVVQWLREQGVTDPEVLRTTAAQAAFRLKNPNVPISNYNFEKIDDKVIPLSGMEKAITSVGDNPVGAYAVNAGQFLSGNTLDNMAANPDRARAAIDTVSMQNPNASAAGQISGGVLASMGGEAILARAGMAPGIARGLAADVGMGAANGAGAADAPDQSRGMNALMSAAMAGAGSLGGNAVVGATRKVIAPAGTGMNALYEAGVRPTLGQRVGDKGFLGATVNKTEQALQSFPIVGPAITGARQEARDQFQVGAFNEALKEVGEKLPKGFDQPGTKPHAYAQKTFDRVYAEARKGMTLVVDEELANDVSGMADKINSLGPDDLNRFKRIVENRVNNKLKSGSASGDDYKKIISGLDDQLRALKSNPQASELSDALTDLKFAIENSARRHSDPDAVALLDAADAGYAKFVRIEGAAARRGGEAGTFSPNQFDAEVQKAEGGVRSKAYNRGDALMQDYAQQGKGLTDTLPNSGTVDRLTATRLGLGVLLSPVAAAYAPGTRKVMQNAFAPAGPKRKAIADQLKKIGGTVSKTGAATGVVLLPGTAPAQ